MSDLSWTQYYYFSIDEVEDAKVNIFYLEDKIKNLREKLSCINKNQEEQKKINLHVNRLEMSLMCIKYYYKI